jgi:hypothetical protein
MKISELLTEGVWVIKNKDGKEKRFKDDQSEAAIAWKNSSSPVKTKKPAKYSEEWWRAQDDADTYPWDKITDLGGIDHIIKDRFGSIQTDMDMMGPYSKEVDGVPVAGRKVRVMFRITPEDDMGVDEPTEDAQWIKVRRDVKNPEKLVFDGYAS